MSDRFDDDDLRAMLEGRADRIHADVVPWLARAVGDEIRVPRRRGPLSMLALPGGVGSLGGAGWLTAAIVGVLAVALLGGRGAAPGPTPGVGSSANPSAPGAVSAVRTLNPDEALIAFEAGDLDGVTALVPGPAVLAFGRCAWVPSPPGASPPRCESLQVAGLPGVGIEIPGWMSTDQLSAAIGAQDAGRLLAIRIEGFSATFLGWVDGDLERPTGVDVFPAQTPSALGLAVVRGWLGRDLSDVGCTGSRFGGQCAVARPTSGWLAAVQPVNPASPGPWLAVDIDPSAAADIGGSSVTATWLVATEGRRGGRGPNYEVTARMDPERTVLVIPGVAETSSPPPSTLSLDQLRSGLVSGELDGRLVAIDGGRLLVQPQPCPSPGDVLSCTTISVAGLPGIFVTFDVSITSVPTSLPLQPGGSRLTLVFRAGTMSLTYLGRSADPLDGTMTVAQMEQRTDLGGDVLAAVSGWLVAGGVHSCPLLGPGATPCPGPQPWLTDDQPGESGMLGSQQGVHVIATDPAVRPATQVVTPGPFLVRKATVVTMCDAAAGVDCSARLLHWEVVSRLDLADLVRVSIP